MAKLLLCLPWGLSPKEKKVGDDIPKATGEHIECKGLRTVKLTIQNQQGQIEAAPSTFALSIKALKEPRRQNRKKH